VDPLIAAVAFLFGLMFGSFLNVCIYRIPLALPEEAPDQPFFRSTFASIAAWTAVNTPARSFCPHCKHLIRWYDNLPVVSWVVLRGRCRDCGARIRFRYAAVELLTGILFLACYARFGLTVEGLKFAVFAFLLTALIFTDAEHRLLPDAFTLPGTVLGFVFSLLVPLNDAATRYAAGLLRPGTSSASLSLLDSMLGAAAGAAFIGGAGLMYKIVRGREGMGCGDIKLMAMIGAFVGIKLALLTIFGAAVLGSVFGLSLLGFVWLKRLRRRIRRNREPAAVALRRAWKSAQVARFYAIPFGVFLGAVALLAVFCGDSVLRWYWGYL
jgi:leader peptidase (prepilin peptidase)/N-methyltransferase